MNRPRKGGGFWPYLYSDVVCLSRIIWQVTWGCNSLAFNYKQGDNSHPVPRGPLWAAICPFTPPWDRLLPNLYPLTTSLWVFVMGSWLELVGIILPPGYLPEPKYKYSRCLPTGNPWCNPPGWWNVIQLPLSSTSWHLLVIIHLFSSPPWKWKALIGYHTWVLRLIYWYLFCL